MADSGTSTVVGLRTETTDCGRINAQEVLPWGLMWSGDGWPATFPQWRAKFTASTMTVRSYTVRGQSVPCVPIRASTNTHCECVNG